MSGGKTAIQKACHRWARWCSAAVIAGVGVAVALEGAGAVTGPVGAPVGEWKTALTMVFSFTL
jgi:hypothetical protein